MAGLVIAIGSMWAGGAAVGAVAGTAFAATLVGTIVSGAVGAVIASAATSVLGIGKQEKQSSLLSARASGQQINIVATDEPIPVWYGFNYKVPSIVPYKDVVGNDWLYRIHIVGEGEIEAFDAAYLDNVASTDAKFAGLVTLEYHTGAAGQAASALLIADIPAKWSAADVGGGIAYVVAKIKNDPGVFPNGEPVLTFDIRGKKVKDTRDGVTRFSNNPALCIRDYWTNTRYGRKVAEAKIADAKISTEATYFEGREAVPVYQSELFTADPTTDIITFATDTPFDNGDGIRMIEVGGVPPAPLIDLTTYYFIRLSNTTGKLATTYANAIARTAINITDAGTGAGHYFSHVDQPRYTANGALDPTADPYANLDKLRSACRSWFFEAAGQYHLVCDKPAGGAPTFTFNEDNIVGAWNIDMGEEDDHYNRVTAHFLDSLRDSQPNFATSDNATERADDGGKLMEGTLQLDMTSNWYMAQRITQIERRKSRLGIKVVHSTTIAGFENFCGEVVYHTHSTPAWTNKLFRLMRLDPKANDENEVELHEYSADVWTGDAQDVMPLPVRTTLPAPDSGIDMAILALESGTAELLGPMGDGTVISRIKVTWTALTNPFIIRGGAIKMQYKKSADAVWIDAPYVDPTSDRSWTGPVQDGVNYDVRVRAVNVFGTPGGWAYVAGHTVVGKTARPSDVTGFAYSTISTGFRLAANAIADADLGAFILRVGGASWPADDSFAAGQSEVTAIKWPPGRALSYVLWRSAAGVAQTYWLKAMDLSGHYSTNAVSVVVNPSAFAAPTVAATLGITDIAFKVTAPTSGDNALVFGGLRIWVDTASPVTMDAAHKVHDGKSLTATIGGLAANTTYYWRAVFYDWLGNDSASISVEASGTTLQTAAGSLSGTVDFADQVSGDEKPANNATVGATWAGNLSGRPANLAALVGSEGIQNGLITLTAGGTLTNAGGGTIDLGSLTGSVTTGQLSANIVAAVQGAFVNLAAITANMGTITSGRIDAYTSDITYPLMRLDQQGAGATSYAAVFNCTQGNAHPLRLYTETSPGSGSAAYGHLELNNLAGDPSSGGLGQLAAVSNRLKYHDGTAWRELLSSLTGVPYSGATGAVDLNNKAVTNVASITTAGVGGITAGAFVGSGVSEWLISAGASTGAKYMRQGNTAGDLYFGLDDSAGSTFFGIAGNYGTVIYRPAATGFALSRGSTVDIGVSATGVIAIPSGVVSIGPTTASTWQAAVIESVLEGKGFALGSSTTTTGLLVQNAYYNSGWKYKTAAVAAHLEMAGSTWTFKTAPAGAAPGDTVTWTDRVVMNATGLSTTGTLGATGTVTGANSFYSSNTGGGFIFRADGGTGIFTDATQNSISMATNGVAGRLVISSAGAVASPGTFDTGRISITGQNTTHAASVLRIGVESTTLHQIRAYGTAGTEGSLQLTLSTSAGLGLGTAALFNTAGLAITASGEADLVLNTAAADVNARNWKFGTNVAAYGDLKLKVGASNGAAPTIDAQVWTATGTTIPGNVGIGTTGPVDKFDLHDGRFSLTDSDVAHGIGGFDTTAYGCFYPGSSTAGGLGITGVSDTDAPGWDSYAIIGHTAPAAPAYLIRAMKKNGSGIQALAATETASVWVNLGTTLMTLLGNGDLAVVGALSKGSGSFDIEHPAREGYRLRHSFIEGPRYDLIYRGRVQLVAGYAEVDLDQDCVSDGGEGMTPGTFEALGRDPDVQLTVYKGWPVDLKWDIEGAVLKIWARDEACTATVSWQVTVERHDPHVRQKCTMSDDEGRLRLEYAPPPPPPPRPLWERLGLPEPLLQ